GLALDAAKKYLKDHTELEGTTLLAASPLNFESQQKAEPVATPAPPFQGKQNNQHLEHVKDRLNSVKEQLLKLSNSL
ncbi:unnamed protein product, partial [marine sediment metagenome]